MKDVIDPVYFGFVRGEIEVRGKDRMDIGAGSIASKGPSAVGGGKGAEGFALANLMLPRMYYPAWQGNVFEQRALDISNQLRGGNMALDFDQIFAKAPNSGGSSFQWHQDAAYWPQLDADVAATTCWLAVSDATLENGCLRYIPGSHLQPQLRTHYSVGTSREAAVTLFTPLDEAAEIVVHAPARRGDLIVHHERCLHASSPNLSPGWRHTYVLSVHKAEWVAAERAAGITYSYNDAVSWQTWNRWELVPPGSAANVAAVSAAAGGGPHAA